MKIATLRVDGASRGNPGAAGIGVVISDERGAKVAEISEYIGNTTNNVAEYTALVRGLQEAIRLGAISVRIFADSELLVRQVTGAYKVKAAHLRPLYEAAVGLLSKFRDATIVHVPREENADADKLASQAAKTRKSTPQPHAPSPDKSQQTMGF